MTEEEAWLRMFCAWLPRVSAYDPALKTWTEAARTAQAAAQADAGLVEFRKRFGQTRPYREGGNR